MELVVLAHAPADTLLMAPTPLADSARILTSALCIHHASTAAYAPIWMVDTIATAPTLDTLASTAPLTSIAAPTHAIMVAHATICAHRSTAHAHLHTTAPHAAARSTFASRRHA